jgi:mannose-6-phosphate isomerase-like protein (cupin superfamily)
MGVWVRTIVPGAETPVHRHACEEVIVVPTGSGRVTVEGEESDFGPNSTIIVPPNVAQQLVNTGPEEMFLVTALGTAPMMTADGQPIPLPWQAP